MATNLANVLADFETQLTLKTTIGGTTSAILNVTDPDGVTLPNGRYFLTIDNNIAGKEHIVCTLNNATKAISAVQSVSRQGVLTAGFARVHKVGASVKLTDFATLYFLNEMVKGNLLWDSTKPIQYDGTVIPTLPNQLATKSYVDGVAFGVGVLATDTVFGYTKLSVPAANPLNPIVVGDNDTRVPTQAENNAMVGTSGAPDTNNKYVTDDDTVNDDVDQSQTTQNGSTATGEANLTTKQNKIGQSFVAGKTSITGARLYKIANTGAFVGDLVVELFADTAGSPSGAALATVTIANATYNALAVGEFTATFASPYTSVIGTTYWLVISASTSDNANHPNMGTNTAGGYTSGSVKFNNTPDGWVAIATIDLYFKIITSVVGKAARYDANAKLPANALGDYAASSAGSDSYAITVPLVGGVLTTGMKFRVKADVANSSAATLNINNIGAIAIVKNISTPLDTGDILANQIFEVTYDGTNFQMGSLLGAGTIVGNKVLIFPGASTATSNAGVETTLLTGTVPGGLLKTNNAIKLSFNVTAFTTDNNNQVVTLRFKYGATTVASYAWTFNLNSVNHKGSAQFFLTADGATNAQKGSMHFLVTQPSTTTQNFVLIGDGDGTAAIDSTVNQTLSVTIQAGNQATITVNDAIASLIS